VIGTYVDPSGHRQGIGRLLFESTPNGPPARRSEPDWRKEGAYLNRYVTDEQRRRRPIFNATLRAATSSLYARRYTRRGHDRAANLSLPVWITFSHYLW
jgi:hypothetical protein